MTASRSLWMFMRAIEDLVNLCTKRKKGLDFDTTPTPRLVFKIVGGDYFGTSSMQVWHTGISVKVFRQISLFIHYLYIYLVTVNDSHIYLFSKKGFHGPVLTLVYSSKKSVVLSVHCCWSIFYLLYLILKAQFVQLLL